MYFIENLDTSSFRPDCLFYLQLDGISYRLLTGFRFARAAHPLILLESMAIGENQRKQDARMPMASIGNKN